jgi:hypothetical protein
MYSLIYAGCYTSVQLYPLMKLFREKSCSSSSSSLSIGTFLEKKPQRFKKAQKVLSRFTRALTKFEVPMLYSCNSDSIAVQERKISVAFGIQLKSSWI